MLDSQTLVIRNFTYEGTAPDAFLIGGVSTAEPSGDPDLVLQFPFEGEHLGYHDTRVNVFKRFDGQRDLVITLPQNVKADMRAMSDNVWNREHKTRLLALSHLPKIP